MLNPFEDIDKVTIINDPVQADAIASDSDVQPEPQPQPPADNPMPTEPHNLLGGLLTEMNADEQQMFLSYQHELYSAQVESLRQQISTLQSSLVGLAKDREELAAAGYRGLTPTGPYNEDYHIFQTTKEEGVIRDMRRQLQASGIPAGTDPSTTRM